MADDLDLRRAMEREAERPMPGVTTGVLSLESWDNEVRASWRPDLPFSKQRFLDGAEWMAGELIGWMERRAASFREQAYTTPGHSAHLYYESDALGDMANAVKKELEGALNDKQQARRAATP